MGNKDALHKNNDIRSNAPRKLKEILLELAELNLKSADSRDLISIDGMEKVRSKLT
ncbi:hypothetical protein [Ekhidna sp.]|uniref:hypothetical protein n=1 Tax=Ekhidna sp. TaxID=2608089 RepID=UPI003298620C